MGKPMSLRAAVITGWGVALPPYDLMPLRTPKNRKFLSPGASHLLQAGLVAMEHAGWSRETLPGARTAVFSASGQTGPEPSDFFPGFAVAQMADGRPDWAALGGPASRLLDPYFSLRGLANAGLALLAMELGAGGPSNNFVQDGAAGWAALDAAHAAIACGEADVAFCVAGECLSASAAHRLAFPELGDGGEAGVGLVLEEAGLGQSRRAQRQYPIPQLSPLGLDREEYPELGAAGALRGLIERLTQTWPAS